MRIKLRHGTTFVNGLVKVLTGGGVGSVSSTTDENSVLQVVLSQKDKGIAPGQFAGNICMKLPLVCMQRC